MDKLRSGERWIMLAIAAVTICLALAAYPFKLIPFLPYESNYGKGELTGTGSLTGGTAVSQVFHEGPAYLESISIYLQNLQEEKSGNLIVSISNGGQVLMTRTIPLSSIENYEWYPVRLGVRLPKEDDYMASFTTDVQEDVTLQLFAAKPGEGAAENKTYRYALQEQDLSLAVNYRYIKPFHNVGEAVVFFGILALVGGLAAEAVRAAGRREEVSRDGE